jgi:hypothetical protein
MKHSPVLVTCDRCGAAYTEPRWVFDAIEDFGNEHLCPACEARAEIVEGPVSTTIHRPAEDEVEFLYIQVIRRRTWG